MNRCFPGVLLRVIRRLGMTQREFAKQTGVQPSTVTKALAGNRPTGRMLECFCSPSAYENRRDAVDLGCAHLSDELNQMGLSEEILIQPVEVSGKKPKDKKLDLALSRLGDRARRSAVIREMLIDLDTVTDAISEKDLERIKKAD